MREAFYLASSGRPGPVLIDMPKDISGKVLLDAKPEEFHLPGYSVPREGNPEAVAAAAKALKAAQRPILLVGPRRGYLGRVQGDPRARREDADPGGEHPPRQGCPSRDP